MPQYTLSDKPTIDEAPAATGGTIKMPNGNTLVAGGGIASILIALVTMFGSFTSDISRIDAIQAAQRDTIGQITARLDRSDASLNEVQRKLERAVTILENMDERQRREIAAGK